MALGSRLEFLNFYEAHVTKVRGLLYRFVGESLLQDLTQEVFMKAWEHRKDFKGQSEASTWLYRISYNTAVDHLRKNKIKFEAFPEEIVAEESLEKTHSDRQLATLVLQALDLDHRIVTVLFYLKDQSVKEISEILKIPEGTVKSRLNHSRAKMLQTIEQKGAVS